MKRFTIKYLMLSALCIFSTAAYAQTRISGIVTGEENAPLAGALVVVKGTGAGTATDAKGHYSITIPAGEGRELEVTLMGYNIKTVPVGANAAVVNVVLALSSVQLEEVVVGYGSVRKSDVTGSVSSVKIDETFASQVTSLDQLLRGKAAGVEVASSTGAPGAQVNIRVRGYSSFMGGSEPLYVVDGVILNNPSDSDDQSLTRGGTATNNTQENTNGMLGIAPQDIADIQILKDASATAIYGAMGANGVVLITTKMGSRSTPTVNWISTMEISTPRRLMPMLDFYEYIDYLRFKGNTAELERVLYDPYYPRDGLNEGYHIVNWQDYALSTRISHRHRVAVSGKISTTNYNIAGSYDDVNGLMRNTGSEVANLRVNLDQNLTPHVKIGMRMNFSRIRLNMTQSMDYTTSTAESSVIRAILNKKPYLQDTEKFEEGEQELDGETRSDPRMWFKDYSDHTSEYRVTPQFTLEAKILKWMTYNFTLGGDYRSTERGRWKGPYIIGTSDDQSVGARVNTRRLRYNMDNVLNFRYNSGDHRLNTIVGTSFTGSTSRVQTVEGWNILEPTPQDEGINGAPNARLKYSQTKSAILSYLTRAVYSYKDRYVLTVSFRADGSSKFFKNERFRYFPAVAFAWRINEESWFNAPFVDNLKLRLGWGMMGNEASLPAYSKLSTFLNDNTTKYPDHTPGNASEATPGAATAPYMANAALTWETSETYNGGIDLSLFRERVVLSVDAYQKITRDLLHRVAIPSVTGFTYMYQNGGQIRNRGVEISFDLTPVSGRDFTWNVSGNISINRNKILDSGYNTFQYWSGNMYDANGDMIAPQTGFVGSTVGGAQYFNSYANIFVTGLPMGLFYGLQTDGIVQTGEMGPNITAELAHNPIGPGGIKYVIQNKNRPGDAERTYVDPNLDRVIIGNPHPKFTYGFATSFSYKAFTLSAAFNGSYDFDIVNVNALIDTDITRNGNIRRDAFRDMWSESNPNGKYPSLDQFQANEKKYFTDRIVEDGSFLRFANLTLNYEIPVKKIRFIQSLSVNVSASNIFVWTKYTGWDPEVSSYGTDVFRMGVDSGAYPSARTFSVGLNATF